MSGEADAGERDEEPTEKRLSDARNDGQTRSSREVVTLAVLVAFGAWLAAFGPAALDALVRTLAGTLALAGDRALERTTVMPLARTLLAECGLVLAPLFAMLALAAVAAHVVQNDPRPVLKRLRPKASHLSLVGGVKRMFGRSGLMEFAKGVFKLTLAGTVGLLATAGAVAALAHDLGRQLVHVPSVLMGAGLSMLAATCILFAALALADGVTTRMAWRRGLRMSRKEVTDERKQAEGDPMIRAHRRSLAASRGRTRMMEALPGATLVVANPVHVAVALRYRPGEDRAPVVVAKGGGHLCERIKTVAREAGVPVFEAPPLARSLYRCVEIEGEIPVELYALVAELINSLARADARAGGRAA